jgi:hypothetical protein
MDMRYNYDMRTLMDFHSADRPGFFTAFVGGRRFSKLIYRVDPLGVGELSPEEVALASYGDSDWGYWAAFHNSEEHAQRKASSAEDHRLYDIMHHEITTTLKGTHITAADRITLKILQPGVRVFPFDLYRKLRVGRVEDASGTELQFIQEDKDEDADLAIILPAPAQRGQELKLTVHYQGDDTLQDSGGGNFILLPRSTWYPNNPQVQFGDRALFNMTFSYPKNHVLTGTGSLTGPETQNGDTTVSKWSSGQTELVVAGFNYGKFKKKSVKGAQTGYEIEFYANTELPSEIKAIQHEIQSLEADGGLTGTTLGSITTTAWRIKPSQMHRPRHESMTLSSGSFLIPASR